MQISTATRLLAGRGEGKQTRWMGDEELSGKFGTSRILCPKEPEQAPLWVDELVRDERWTEEGSEVANRVNNRRCQEARKGILVRTTPLKPAYTNVEDASSRR